MSFVKDNEAFEDWLRDQCAVVKADLKEKHKRMAQNPFRFLRATCFRWAKKIEKVLPDLADAPQALSVGDAHLENFGTWRDGEGRLVWGVNDFDDAALTPYVFDLVRLCVSVKLSHYVEGAAAPAILTGYARGLQSPRPMILDGDASWLRPFVAPSTFNREEFKKQCKIEEGFKPPAPVLEGFATSFPEGAGIAGYARRTKGGGSLGRPRFAAIAQWRGGKIVREAKALVPSAWDWARKKEGASKFMELAQGPYRAPDPFLHLNKKFIFRRSAADSRKLDFEGEIPLQLQSIFLEAMGHELGSIHAAGPKAGKIAKHLEAAPDGWLDDAAEKAAAQVMADFKEWREAHPKLME
jgi:hypothetical protein